MGLRNHWAFFTLGVSGRWTGCRDHQSALAFSPPKIGVARERTSAKSPLGQNVLDNFAVYIGQAHVAAAEADGEFFVIHAQQMQHGGV